MRTTGIVRRIDDLGRVVIPKEFRRNLDMREGDALEIFTQEDTVVFRKYAPGDIFTGNMEDLVEYKGKKVSKETIKTLAKVAGLI